MSTTPRVVIVGAGFAGLRVAQNLRKAPVDVLLVDQYNYHTFQPLLYQVATAALEPDEVAHAVRGIYQKQPNFDFRLAKVSGVDWDNQQLLTENSGPIPFDYLVLAAGASTNYFGIDGVEEHAFPLKSLAEAINLRSHIMRQFEMANADPSLIDQGYLNFVVVGGGPTGVEMAGALVDLFGLVLRKDYHHLDVDRAEVYLVEAMDHLLPPFHDKSRETALETLRERGVEVLLNQMVVRATADAVYFKSGKMIPTHTLIWAAGVRANPLADALGLEQTRGGRVVVERDLSVPGHPMVFAVGDMAASLDEEGNLLPQVAQPAIQGGQHVAKQILRKLEGQATRPFKYHDYGIMATIGHHAAVVEVPGGIRFRGFIAWVMWLFLHLLYLVGFRNRLNVFVNWAWNYFTYDRSARMILDMEPEPRYEEVDQPGQIEKGWSGDKQLEHPVEL